MSLGDCKLSYADKTVHFARCFVTEKGRGFVKTHGKVTVASAAVKICLVLEGAGHGTQCENFLVFFLVAQNEHAILIMIPVT